MPRKLKDRPERDRPELPKTPFLCASCRHGLVLVQKVPVHDRHDRKEDPWKCRDAFTWDWEARCLSPRIAGKAPEAFYHPIVDCEGFEARKDGTSPPADDRKS